jgi:hypothetical protein
MRDAQCGPDLKCEEVTIAQVPAVRQAPLPARILVAPAVALPGGECMSSLTTLLGMGPIKDLGHQQMS